MSDVILPAASRDVSPLNHERVLGRVQPGPSYRPALGCDGVGRLKSWQLDLEVACWLRSNFCSDSALLALQLVYEDSLRRHRHTIDNCEAPYLQDALLSGGLRITGFGDFTNARLVLLSNQACGQINILDLNLRCFSVASRLRRELKLVA